MFGDVITPVLKATPQAWYNPEAVWPKGVFPPGTMIDWDDFERASRQWKAMETGTKTYDQSGMEEELKKNRIKPGMLSSSDLESVIDDIYRDLRSKGNIMTGFGPTEKSNLIKAYAKPEPTKPSVSIGNMLDRYKVANAGTAKAIVDAGSLDAAIDDIESMAAADGTQLEINPKEVLKWARDNYIS